MKQNSEDEQALIKTQHDWGKARIKGDSSYTRRLEYGDTGIVVGQGTIKAHEGKQNLLGGNFVWTDVFMKQDGDWKVVASQVTPVLKK